MTFSAIIPKNGKLATPWLLLFVVNFFIMGANRYFVIPLPLSVTVEIFYLICLVSVLTNKNNDGNVKRASSAMIMLYMPWLMYSILEVANVSADIDYNTIVTRWFAEVRTMGFQIIYGILICAAVFVRKEQIKTMYLVWGLCVILCTLKTLMQQHIGFDTAELLFLQEAGKTHFVNGIIRYFSLFSDAANYGCNMAATTAVFGAVTLSSKLKKEKIFFGTITLCALYGMFASGTRAAIFVLAVGGIVYSILSKRISALVTTIIVGGTFMALLIFTNIGQGNNMIRRMRSAFNKEDASFTVREVNQQAMRRYIDELPMGLGAGLRNGDVPQSNKNHFLSVVAPDSTWVYVNIHYGHLGKFLFLFSFIGICIYAGYIVFFRIRDPELRGLLAALVSGSSAMIIAGYANQIMLQYPNCFLFFGQLMIVFLGPDIDRRMEESRRKEDIKLIEDTLDKKE